MHQVRRWVCWVLVLTGCQPGDVVPKKSDAAFYPLQKGHFWTYNVVETTISQVDGQTNQLYQLKVLVTDSITSVTPVAYVLSLYRKSGAGDWQPTGTWTARKEAFSVIVQEGNTPYIKLALPLNEGKYWDGNALNNNGGTDACADGTNHCDNYVSTQVGKPYDGDGFSLSDAVIIQENNDDDPIVGKDIRTSVYGRSVGLVYREITSLSYCTVGSCIGQKIVENGYIYTQTMTSYGRE